MTTTSLVIRSFNEEAHIGRLLTGIIRQSDKPEEIIVVDSGSTDATPEIASRFPVKILSIDSSDFSFGRSLNKGIEATTGDIVVIASAHVYPVYDSWLSRLCSPLRDPQIALSYGKQMGAPHSRFSEKRILAKWFPDASAIPQEHPFCNNANAAIRRPVWEQIPYNEQLTGLEDLDWAKRALESGHRIAYVAEAPVVHVHDESLRQVANRYRREAIAYKGIYSEQGLTLPRAAWLTLTNVLSDYFHAAQARCLAETIVDTPLFRAAQFWGSYRGFTQEEPVTAALRRRFYYPSGLKPDLADTESNEAPIDYSDVEASRNE